MKGAIAKAEELKESIPGAVILGQFDNPANPAAHAAATGPEIWEDTDGEVDIFVAGVGTGGTITGVGTYLKSKNPEIKVVAVEPDSSPVLSGGNPGSHKIQGIGAGFVPKVLNTNVYDEIIRVKNEDAFVTGKNVAVKEGILVGISSGAALAAAVELAKREENKGKTIVALLPETGISPPRCLRSDCNSSTQNFALAAKSVQKSVGRKRIQLIDKSPLAGAGCLKPQLYWPDALQRGQGIVNSNE